MREFGGVLVGLINLGVLKILDNGKTELVAVPQAPALLAFKSDKKEIVVFQGRVNGVGQNNYQLKRPLYRYDGQKLTEQGIIQSSSFNDLINNARLKILGKNTFLFTSKGIHRKGQNSSFSSKPFQHQVYDILSDEEGQIWTTEGVNGGVKAYKNIEDIGTETFTTLIKGVSAVDLLRDRDGGYWVTTLEKGVFYLRDKRVQIFNQTNTPFPAEGISFVESAGDTKVFIGFQQGEIGLFDKSKRTYQTINRLHGNHLFDMKYATQHKKLWFGNESELGTWQNGQLKTLNSTSNSKERLVGIKRIALRPHQDAAWVLEPNGRLNEVAGSGSLTRTNPELLSVQNRLFSLFEDSYNQLWLSKQDGLYGLNKDSLVAVPFIHNALQTRIEDIAELLNGSLVFATKGNGIVIWDGKNAVHISKTDGLLTDMIENLATDAQGNIWVGTLAGLHKLSPPSPRGGDAKRGNVGNGQWRIQPITMFHGLPTNEINDIAPNTEGVFLATPKGLVFYQDKTVQAATPMPFLENIKAGQMVINISKSMVFGADENDIDLTWNCINFQMFGKIPYRYRLDSTAQWRLTHNKNVQLAALSAGDYFFEVQAQNEDGEWSPSLKVDFKILPHWYETGLFRGFLLLLTLVGGYLFYKNRIRNLQKEHAIALQINDLERSALATQMNPHFIFNCLNSIQLLIQRGAKEEAMSYLSRFAKMVRFTLESTRRGKVTIEEEVQALTNYLTLEKLRFKEDLVFSVQTDNNMDSFSAEIPAMLIQPFVENALKHGFESMDKIAKIGVFFDVQDDFLHVEVRDNGKGFAKNVTHVVTLPIESAYTEGGELRERTGVGIHLSQQRLALHNGRKEEQDLQIEPILGENESVLGTVVRLKIRLAKAKSSKDNNTYRIP